MGAPDRGPARQRLLRAADRPEARLHQRPTPTPCACSSAWRPSAGASGRSRGDYEEANIDNGVPGYNRVDLLVCRIETAPQETIALKVYKGEETTGTPVVPGHVEGDLNDGDTVCEMPICSVRVNGINPQAPEMLAKESIDIMALLQELRDYKSQMLTAKGIATGGIGSDKLAANAVTAAKLDAATRDLLSRCVRRTYADETLLATYHVAATVPASGVYTYSVAADFKSIGLAVAQINESSSSLVCNSCIVSGTSVHRRVQSGRRNGALREPRASSCW
ncbi:MAG: hypothetical protein ACLTDR_11790 [Adlercreutzia equolifaciens]